MSEASHEVSDITLRQSKMVSGHGRFDRSQFALKSHARTVVAVSGDSFGNPGVISKRDKAHAARVNHA